MSRSSNRRDGPHSSGSSAMASRVAASSAQSAAVRRAASAACDRASATMSARASSRTSATGARGVPRMSAEIVPRTLPMPLENSRVTSSAPTNACHWRSASARRNVPRARSSRRDAQLRLVRGLRAPAQRVGLDRLVLHVVGDALEQGGEPGEAAGQRAGGERPAGVAVAPERVDPGTERRDGIGRQSVGPLVERALGDREHLERAGSRGPRRRGRGHRCRTRRAAGRRRRARPARSAGVVRHPVDDDDQRQAAVAGPEQDVPRHAVGVAGRGRDEDAEVGGLREAVGQLPVRVLDRVDVGRVDERDAARLAFVRDDAEPLAGERRRAGTPSLMQRVAVVGVDDGDELAGRRAQDAGRDTARPARAFTRLDLPAPVGPISSTSSGASRLLARGQHVPGEVVAEARARPRGAFADDPLRRALGGERVEPFGEREEIRVRSWPRCADGADAPPHAQPRGDDVVSVVSQVRPDPFERLQSSRCGRS